MLKCTYSALAADAREQIRRRSFMTYLVAAPSRVVNYDNHVQIDVVSECPLCRFQLLWTYALRVEYDLILSVSQ